MVPAAQKSHDAPTSSLHLHTRCGETKNNNNNALASLPVEPVLLTPLLLHPSDQQHDRPALTTAAKVERASARESEWLAVAASCTRTEGGQAPRTRPRRTARTVAAAAAAVKARVPRRQSQDDSKQTERARESRALRRERVLQCSERLWKRGRGRAPKTVPSDVTA